MQRTVDYTNGKAVMIDQTRLPSEMVVLEMDSVEQIAEAISSMRVRGAPAIGVSAAIGMALAARQSTATEVSELIGSLEDAAALLKGTRPTAVNLFWGIDRMLDAAMSSANEGLSRGEIVEQLDRLAESIVAEDESVNRLIGRHGAELLPQHGGVLTHCNAGALACVGYGTALGVVRAAMEAGKRIHVYADETRPRLQGMKLTCFELLADSIPVTLVADNMAASLMKNGAIDCVVVGADRIAANGDVANKIGTYSVAVLARYHNIPFYVAAPVSTIDFSLGHGDDIPIEERSSDEMTHIDGARVAPEGIAVMNPSFDVTPNELVSAIVTENGIARPGYGDSLTSMKRNIRQ